MTTDFTATKRQFHLPEGLIYLDGNSLGPLPKTAAARVAQAITSEWGELLIRGWNKAGWMDQPTKVGDRVARLIGAEAGHVVMGDTLSIKVYQALASALQLAPQRRVILSDTGNFPSDLYMAQGLAQTLGADYRLKTVAPEAVLEAIDDTVAVVMITEVDYRSGRRHDMAALSARAHAVGAMIVWDLAHSAGAFPLQVAKDGADFAVGCSYKYLNAGPGAVGGVFVHEKWATNTNTPRLGGWWGNDEATRFKMEKGFLPKPNASGWNISTTQVFNCIGLKTSLELFDEAGIENLRKKSISLTNYLAFLMQQLPNLSFEIITPSPPHQRGAQLSLYFKENAKAIHNKMIENGIIVDFREPGVIRLAPAPMYCSYLDVHQFYCILRDNF